MYTFLFNHHGNGNAQALDLVDLTLRLRSLYWGFRSSGSTAVCLHLSQRQVVDDLPWSISLFWGTRGSPRPCGWRAQKWAVCFGHQSSMPVQWTCQQVPTWVLHRQPFPTWVPVDIPTDGRCRLGLPRDVTLDPDSVPGRPAGGQGDTLVSPWNLGGE